MEEAEYQEPPPLFKEPIRVMASGGGGVIFPQVCDPWLVEDVVVDGTTSQVTVEHKLE